MLRRDLEHQTLLRLENAGKITEGRYDRYMKDIKQREPKEEIENKLLDFIHNPLFSDVTIV